jgi:hypothetical protein
MDSGDYLKALEHLDQEFIQTGNYEHRDVPKLFWGLVYAKSHEGNFPAEWESLSGFKTLSQHLVEIEQGRVQQLRTKLDSWSQAKILETIGREHQRLGEYEEQAKDLEVSLNEAETQGIDDEQDELEAYRRELGEIRAQIQVQRDTFFKINVKEAAQKVKSRSGCKN